MNALKLYHDLKKRGVLVEACEAGGRLKVDAPAGELTKDDRAALAEFKPVLLKLLSRTKEAEDDGRRFDARRSRHPGYTALYDPIEGRWHDFPTKECYPSVMALANGRRKEGATA